MTSSASKRVPGQTSSELTQRHVTKTLHYPVTLMIKFRFVRSRQRKRPPSLKTYRPMHIREKDQQDAHFSSLIYSNWTILYMFRTNTCSLSGGYFGTRSVHYFSCIYGCL